MQIRDVTPADFEAIQAIYAHHVLTGTGSFAEEPPTLEDLTVLFSDLLAKQFPHLVAVDETGQIMGYCYAGPYTERSASRFTGEDSIYIHPDFLGRGVGRSLLNALIRRCAEQGFQQMMAVIGDSENTASVGLHKSLGFEMIGTARNIGFKFGRHLDVVYMQKQLGQ